ncbi:MAG: hypothetical protein QOH65_1863 [Methylobacteriaceae bacterium]|nr:hypothetical protein [Methylobacteriaceae bacterium]
MKRTGVLAAAVGISAMMAGSLPGFAADLSVVVPPPVVVVPAPVVVVPAPVLVPVLPHIWLGHFTGGARTAVPGVMDWHDEFARFASRRECLHWLRALKAAYRAQEGFKTCLPIR